MSYKEKVSKVRRALKLLCPTISVRMAPGTARQEGWVDISPGESKKYFTTCERNALSKFGIPTSSKLNTYEFNDKDMPEWLRKANEIINEYERNEMVFKNFSTAISQVIQDFENLPEKKKDKTYTLIKNALENKLWETRNVLGDLKKVFFKTN
jgi:hypothetical protein